MKKGKIIMTIGAIALMGIGTIVGIATNGTEAGEIYETEADKVAKIEITENDFRVMELRNNGILIGDERGDLQLKETLKRQEMVVIISRLMGKEAEAKSYDASKLTFEDVGKENWAAGYIAWAKENNITKGYSEEWFGYDDTLTEKQTAIFLLRVLGYEEADIENAEELASEVGVIGYYDILEDEAITREEVAKMLYETLYCRVKESEEELGKKLGIEAVYEGAEREIAIIMSEAGIEYKSMIETEGWKIIYADLKGKEINAETVKEDLSIYYGIGNSIEYSHYVIVDVETNRKIEVTNYTEYGVIYQIKVDDKLVYEYEEE